jgi:hypothetical protein
VIDVRDDDADQAPALVVEAMARAVSGQSFPSPLMTAKTFLRPPSGFAAFMAAQTVLLSQPVKCVKWRTGSHSSSWSRSPWARSWRTTPSLTQRNRGACGSSVLSGEAVPSHTVPLGSLGVTDDHLATATSVTVKGILPCSCL